MKRKDIVIDFDGTCVEHKFPAIGRNIGARPVLRELVKAGHRLILSTMRSDIKVVQGSEHKEIIAQPGNYLTAALGWFEENNIELYGIQTNPSQKRWTSSPKAYGHLHIDDAALGCPLIYVAGGKPYVDWTATYLWLVDYGYLNYQERVLVEIQACKDQHYAAVI